MGAARNYGPQLWPGRACLKLYDLTASWLAKKIPPAEKNGQGKNSAGGKKIH